MKTSLLPMAVAVATVAFVSPAFAQAPAAPAAPATAATPAPKPFGPVEKNFVNNAAKTLTHLIQVAAAGKTLYPDGREGLGRLRNTVERDLKATFEALKKLAATRGETVSSEPTPGDQASVERLSKLKDDRFTKEWLDTLAKESKKLNRDFEMAGKTIKDPDLQQFASNYTPMVSTVATDAEKQDKNWKPAKK